MTAVTAGLVAQGVLTVLAVAVAVLSPARARSRLAGGVVALAGLAAVATGVLALSGHAGPLTLTAGGVTLTLAPDPLGGLFMALVGAVGAVTAWFGTGYAHGPVASRSGWTAFALFLGGMLLVTAAGDVVVFLFGWETMALASTVLVASDHATRTGVRSAVAWYAVFSHASFLAVLVGLVVLATAAGGISLDELAASHPDPSTATVAFVALAVGFALKAGLVPLHVWLPRAHPEAPSHVSAAMSAAMVKLGIYGLLMTILRLLPDGPRWWWVALLVLGLASALYGILQASVTSHLKRLLAYSTTENTGLIVVAIAVSGLAAGAGRPAAADAAAVAAVLLALSHAAFKATLFMAAGAAVAATGEEDLDRMGGLVSRMPVTAGAIIVGSMGAAALPVTAGFVAEWALLQALVHGAGAGDRLSSSLLPVTVAVVALVTGLALLTFVKVVGIAVFSRPRSAGAATAEETAPSARWALGVGAVAVVVLGLVPGWVATAAAGAVGATGVEASSLAGLSFPGLQVTISPAVLSLVGMVVAAALALATVLMRARRRRVVDLPWGCGGVRVDPRMQYTATSFAEPVMRVFDDALRPSRHVSVTPTEESAYLVRSVEYHQVVVDRVEQLLYRPMVRVVDAVGDAGRRLHNGRIGRYLTFSFVALVLVLLAVAR